MDSHHWESVIRGHHVFKDIWSPFVGEILNVQQEVHNAKDRFAVVVVKNETIIDTFQNHALFTAAILNGAR